MPIDPSIPLRGDPVEPLDVQGIALRRAAIQEAQARQQDRQRAEAEAAQAQQQADAMREALRVSLVQDPQTGAWVPDRNALMRKFGGALPKPVQDAVDASDKYLADFHKSAEAKIAHDARLLSIAGNDPSDWNSVLDSWEKNKVLTPDEVAHYRKAGKDQASIAQLTAMLSGQKPGEGQYTLGKEDTRFDAAGKEVARGIQPTPKPDKLVFSASPNKGALTPVGSVPADAVILQQPQPTQASGAPGADSLRSDPDALARAGAAFRILGTPSIPTRLGEQDRIAIMKEASKQDKDLRQSPVQSIQKQAAFKSDASALTQMTKMASSAEAFENKALAQAQIIEQLSPQVGRSASPALNALLLAGKVAVTGDSPTSQLYNAIQTFSTEYAKIMEGSTGSVAASSDFSRAAAKKLIDASMNPKTLSDVVALMKREMALTRQGYDATIDHITTRMGGSGQANSSSPREGEEREVPGHPGVIAVFRNGKWIVK